MSQIINYTYLRVLLTHTRIRPTVTTQQPEHSSLSLPDVREESLARTLMRFRCIKRRPGYVNIPLTIQNSIGYLMRQEKYHAGGEQVHCVLQIDAWGTHLQHLVCSL
jgi:hypothetical protein